MYTEEEKIIMQVAVAIWDQMGGPMFGRTVSANNFICGRDKDGNAYLKFQFSGCRKANHCQITSMPKDLYKMEFSKAYQYGCEKIFSERSIYCDILRESFEDFTGVHTASGWIVMQDEIGNGAPI